MPIDPAFVKQTILVLMNITAPEPAPEPVTGAVKALRAFHYENSLPWLDEGVRCLPSAHYQNYKAGFEPLKDALEAAARGVSGVTVSLDWKSLDPSLLPAAVVEDAEPASAVYEPVTAEGIAEKMREFMK